MEKWVGRAAMDSLSLLISLAFFSLPVVKSNCSTLNQTDARYDDDDGHDHDGYGDGIGKSRSW